MAARKEPVTAGDHVLAADARQERLVEATVQGKVIEAGLLILKGPGTKPEHHRKAEKLIEDAMERLAALAKRPAAPSGAGV